MEQKIPKLLSDLGYTGELQQQALEEGPKNVEYTKCVNYLTNELRSLCNIDEEVNIISAPDDSVSFLMELSSFLKELGCPHNNLTQGHISERLESKEDKMLLLDYLITELMAARILQETLPDKKIELKLKETPQACNLRKMLMTLRFPKPPANITVPALFQKLQPSVHNLVQKAGGDLLGSPICNFTINEKQWDTLDRLQKQFHDEYKIRREMLLKRLDCTIQSFQWSDKMKGKEELIDKIYSEKRKLLKVEPDVNISDLLSAREDLAIIEKTSNASVRKNTQTAINKVIIGKVPDRGGRTSEQAPPPPEMPSWQQRQAGPSGGGRGGGRGRGDFNNRGFSARGGGGGYGGGNDYNRGGNNYNRGSNDYSRGGNDYNRGGGKDYNRGGNDYNRGGNDYNRGGNDYNRGSNDYNQGGNNNYNQGNDYNRSQSNYNRGAANIQKFTFDSAGSYSLMKSNYSDSSSTSGSRGRESSGSDYQNEPKRPKTYDSFQSNKSTYADQYVQESEQNQQYHSRDNRNSGRGRSNYHRGGGGGGHRGGQNYY